MGINKEMPDCISKLKIDITFDDSMNKDEEIDQMLMETGAIPYDYNQSPHFYLASQSLPQAVEQPDLSYMGGFMMEQKTHLGIASCRLISYYVDNYKCLRDVSILLKLFLAKFNLNSPYHGK